MALWDRVRGLPPPTPHVRAQQVAERGVAIYWRPGCGYCALLGARVRKVAGRAAWVNIWEDPDGAAYVRDVNGGAETVPTVVIRGVPHTNPNPAVVKAALEG